MPPLTIGITLTLNTQGAVVSANNLNVQLNNVRARARTAGGALSHLSGAAQDLHQGLINVVSGLQFLKSHLLDVTRGIRRFGEAAVKAFAEAELGFARIDVVIGRVGSSLGDAALTAEAEAISEKVLQVARDTEFMVRDVQNAFIALKQGGLEAADAITTVDKVIQLATASAGKLSIDEAAKTAVMAQSALGIAADDTERLAHAFDMMFAAQNKTMIQVEEFRQIFRSLRNIKQTLDMTPDAQFVAAVSMLRQMNKTAAQAGQSVNALGRTLALLMNAMEGGTGPGAKRRFKAVQALGIDRDDLVDARGNFRTLEEIVNKGVERYNQLTAEVGKAEAWQRFRTAWGSDIAADVFRAAAGYKKGFSTLIAELDATGNYMESAQQRILSTLSKQFEIMTGSIDTLLVKIGQLKGTWLQGLVRQITKVLNLIIDWVDANPELAETLANIVAIVGAVSGALAVAIGTMIVMNFAMMAMGAHAVAAGGGLGILGTSIQFLRAILVSSWSMFAPLVAPILTIIGLAYMVRTAYEKNLGGFRDWINAWAKDIADVWHGLGDLIQHGFMEASAWDNFSSRAQNIISTIWALGWRVYDFWQGFKRGFVPAIELGISTLIGLKDVFLLLIYPLVFLYNLIVDYARPLSLQRNGFMSVGEVIGWLAGLFLTLKVVIYAVNFATAVWSTTLAILRGALWAFQAVQTLIFLFSKLALVQKIAAAATWLFNLALWSNPLVLIVGAIIAVIAAVGLLIYYFDEVGEALYKSWEWIKQATWDAAVWLERALTQFGQMVSDWFDSVFMKAIDDSLNWFGEQMDALVDWFASIGPRLKEHFMYIGRFWRDVLVGMWAWLMNVVDRIGNAWTKFWSWLWQYLVDTVKEWGNSLKEVGRNVINSIWDGMKEVADSMVQWVEDLASDIADLWPFSPAKRGPLRKRPPERAGQQFMNLLAEGMASRAPRVLATVTQTTNRLVENVNQYTSPFKASSVLSDLAMRFWQNAFGRGTGAAPAMALASFAPNLEGFGPLGRPVQESETAPLVRQPATPANPAPQAFGVAGGGSSPVKKEITVHANINTGDFKFSPQSLSGPEARAFMDWLVSQLGDRLTDHLRAAVAES